MMLRTTLHRETMGGKFFIIKGQYGRGIEPLAACPDGEGRFIGGYNPYLKGTNEWYQLVDRKNYVTTICGGDIKKVLEGYRKMVVSCGDDFSVYEERNPKYLEYEDDEKRPQRHKRCTTSKVGTWIAQAVEREWGDYLEDELDTAYREAAKELEGRRTPKRTLRKKGTTATLPRFKIRISLPD